MEEIEKRLDKIEHQLKFFAEAYKTLHNMFINGVNVKVERELLEPVLSNLQTQMREFRSLMINF